MSNHQQVRASAFCARVLCVDDAARCLLLAARLFSIWYCTAMVGVAALTPGRWRWNGARSSRRRSGRR